MTDTEKTSYPSDEPYSMKRAYPSDEPYFMRYSGSGGEETRFEGDASSEALPASKGRGRRGGNASASRVIRSGVEMKKPRIDTSDPKERKKPRADTGGRKNRENSGKKQSPKRDGEKSGNKEARGDRRNFENISGSARGSASRAYELEITGVSDVGAFVDTPGELRSGVYGKPVSERVLIPFSEQIGRPREGEKVTVRFYEDKGGRLTATMRTPIAQVGEIGRLKVSAVTGIGIFLSNGMPKEVLLPYREQTASLREGDEALVYLYTDKSGREAATMRIYKHLSAESPYRKGDKVAGFVYEIHEKLGVFVAVDDRFCGLVPAQEVFRLLKYGDTVTAYVSRVRPDGRLDLLLRDKLYKTAEEDAERILTELRRCGGFLPYGDRADAAFIEKTFSMSKNQFKRALSHLYKNHIVDLDRKADTVTLI